LAKNYNYKMEVKLTAPITHYAAKKPGSDKNSHFRRMVKKVGRNEPCPCGSGVKFKSCHRTEAALIALAHERQQHKQKAKEMATSM
jgi:hypothetical protein